MIMPRYIQRMLYIGFIVVSIMSIKSIFGAVEFPYKGSKKKQTKYTKCYLYDTYCNDYFNKIVSPEISTQIYDYPWFDETCFYPGYDCCYDPIWGSYWRGSCGWRYPYWRRYGYDGYPCGDFGYCLSGRVFNIGFGW